jgi:hypothetical protein
MTLFQISERSALVEPILVAAFDGWIDAGGAASAAIERLADDAQTVVRFEDDLLFDYRSRRPVLDVVDGTLQHLDWPTIRISGRSVAGHDVLVLSGPEPDFRWRQLGADLAEVSRQLGVRRWISLGAVPAAVPHTRPVPLFGTASAPGLLPGDLNQGPEGLLRVPAAAISVLELAVQRSGVPTTGLYAQVPHYVSGPYAAATIALLEGLGRILGTDLPLGDLPEETLAQRQRLDAAVGGDDEARGYLERLESMAEDEIDTTMTMSGDELASEIERFLQTQGPDEDEPRLGD